MNEYLVLGGMRIVWGVRPAGYRGYGLMGWVEWESGYY